MRFAVGDVIWVGDFQPMAADLVTCPDCGGTGRLRVIFHDEVQVSIACANCSAGYNPPTGSIIVHREKVSARQAIVTGLEVHDQKTRWHVDGTSNSYRIVDDEQAFDNEADALAFAQKLAAKHEQQQRDRIGQKEKETRSWAWNASYHRREIKEAQRKIEYHSSKLAVAAIKAKEKVVES
jgi:ribosomal protein S27E